MQINENSEEMSLVIFRRDLRLDDNTALIYATQSSKKVLPIFIFDPVLLQNPNRSNNAIKFMQESINDLESQLRSIGARLYRFQGSPEKILDLILTDKELNVNNVFINRDYTPYSLKRDRLLLKVSQNRNTKFRTLSDLLLNEPELVLKRDGSPYSIFTPYFNKAKENLIPLPRTMDAKNFHIKSIEFEIKEGIDGFEKSNQKDKLSGGRKNGIKILSEISKFRNYEIDRDFPAKEATTKLSAHLRFGTISIREAYHKIKNSKIPSLIRQLFWRDFYHYIGFHYPHVFKFPFRVKYNGIKWMNDKQRFLAWKEGKTGFPIVDAGMRQLNMTGFMHNRIRMIVSSFLTKDLLLNWQWGERYFAQNLIDFDLSVNNGNWQWSSSTGCDAVPYFRIFNPWTQQRKYDPQCEYIKKFIVELRHLSPKEIHNLEKRRPLNLKYPKPIVDHSIARKQAIALYKTI